MDSTTDHSAAGGDWREVVDPHQREFLENPEVCAVYRCRGLQLEWRWNDQPDQPWRPFVPSEFVSREDAVDDATGRTPEREAVWLDLFLHP